MTNSCRSLVVLHEIEMVIDWTYRGGLMQSSSPLMASLSMDLARWCTARNPNQLRAHHLPPPGAPSLPRRVQPSWLNESVWDCLTQDSLQAEPNITRHTEWQCSFALVRFWISTIIVMWDWSIHSKLWQKIFFSIYKVISIDLKMISTRDPFWLRQSGSTHTSNFPCCPNVRLSGLKPALSVGVDI